MLEYKGSMDRLTDRLIYCSSYHKDTACSYAAEKNKEIIIHTISNLSFLRALNFVLFCFYFYFVSFLWNV